MQNIPTELPQLKVVRTLVACVILGLIVSGVTAIPLVSEINALVEMTNAHGRNSGVETATWAIWLTDLQAALTVTSDRFPVLFYGTDWLAFGHIVIAVAFIGAFKDPIKNEWLFDFGLIACAMVIPWAVVFGAVREIPIWWRLIDCSFGVFGAIPLWFCRSIVRTHKLTTVT